jgi:predicted peroxiredoxin
MAMASLLVVLPHSTDDPDRTQGALETALACVRAGHDVDLWLAGEGVRLGVKAVAETLKRPASPTTLECLEALVAAGTRLHCSRSCFERRGFEAGALRPGAQLAEASILAELVAKGRVPLSL